MMPKSNLIKTPVRGVLGMEGTPQHSISKKGLGGVCCRLQESINYSEFKMQLILYGTK